MEDDALPVRLERIAEWHAGLREFERVDLRRAAALLRATGLEQRGDLDAILPLTSGVDCSAAPVPASSI
jgi:hypothetical protein